MCILAKHFQDCFSNVEEEFFSFRKAGRSDCRGSQGRPYLPSPTASPSQLEGSQEGGDHSSKQRISAASQPLPVGSAGKCDLLHLTAGSAAVVHTGHFFFHLVVWDCSLMKYTHWFKEMEFYDRLSGTSQQSHPSPQLCLGKSSSLLADLSASISPFLQARLSAAQP